jgi:hypothetical protein
VRCLGEIVCIVVACQRSCAQTAPWRLISRRVSPIAQMDSSPGRLRTSPPHGRLASGLARSTIGSLSSDRAQPCLVPVDLLSPYISPPRHVLRSLPPLQPRPIRDDALLRRFGALATSQPVRRPCLLGSPPAQDPVDRVGGRPGAPPRGRHRRRSSPAQPAPSRAHLPRPPPPSGRLGPAADDRGPAARWVVRCCPRARP